MRKNLITINVFCLLSLFFFKLPCKAVDTQIETSTNDQYQQELININEVLVKETPSEFATQNFKGIFSNTAQNNDPSIPNKQSMLQNIDRRKREKESKTAIFQKSFIKYIKDIYNKRDYSQELSQDGTHIVEFLELSNEMNLETEIVYVGLRLFYNKIKECELIDDTVILHTLSNFPELLERHFISQDIQQPFDLSFIKKQFENILLSKFTDHLPKFQASPDIFLSDLSTDLALYYQQEAEKMQKYQQKKEMRERLRQIIFRFLDTALSRTIWNPQDYQGIWRSFIEISHGIQLLGKYDIIDHMDDLDDLLWTLTHRFCYFMNLTGASLPVDFYEELEHDLDSRTVFFLEYQEQDEGIKTKKETLLESLIQAKTKAIAYEIKGIISMPINYPS